MKRIKHHVLTRNEKESAIQLFLLLSLMKKSLSERCLFETQHNVLLVNLIEANSGHIRQWLESLNDHMLNMEYQLLPQFIKESIVNKSYDVLVMKQ